MTAPAMKINRNTLAEGKLRRDEQDVVSSLDPYLQMEWQSGRGCSAQVCATAR